MIAIIYILYLDISDKPSFSNSNATVSVRNIIISEVVEQNDNCMEVVEDDERTVPDNSNKTILNKKDNDDNSDESVSEDEYYHDSEFDFYEQDLLIEENQNSIKRGQSFTNDDRIMFLDSNLTVSDVLLMLEGINIKFNPTCELQNALLNLLRILSGHTFESWDYSPYLLSKTVVPPPDTLKKHYYCPDYNVLLEETLLSSKKKISLQCEKCQKVYSNCSKNCDHFISLDVKLQLENLLSRKDIQMSMNDYTKKEQNKKPHVITDLTDSELYNKNIKDCDVISFNFSTDGAQLFKSSKKALWPLQLHLNCLLGQMRFKNPVIIALWQTDKEPTPEFMDLFVGMNE